jgi:hypothetical protein
MAVLGLRRSWSGAGASLRLMLGSSGSPSGGLAGVGLLLPFETPGAELAGLAVLRPVCCVPRWLGRLLSKECSHFSVARRVAAPPTSSILRSTGPSKAGRGCSSSPSDLMFFN